jgi:hypothetical protein
LQRLGRSFSIGIQIKAYSARAERELTRATEQHAHARRDLKEFIAQKFRRQRRRARQTVRREVERLLAEHEEERRQFRLPRLSPEERKAVIDGIRGRVAVPSDDGSMPWSNIQVVQDLWLGLSAGRQ